MAHGTWSGLTEEQNKQWENWEKQFVPFSGKAETVAGEIIRAMDRLIYRWFNDGDRAGIGYGNITCNSSDRFISSILPFGIYKNLDNPSLSEGEYEAELMDNHVRIYEYLTKEGQKDFYTENAFDSRESSNEDAEREMEYYAEYDEEYNEGEW